jgi:hypothetical protein
MSILDISRSDEDPRQSVLATCEGLHMLVHGSMPDWSDGEADRIAAWLQIRVDMWKPGPDFAKAYDDAVLALAVCALREYAAFRLTISPVPGRGRVT